MAEPIDPALARKLDAFTVPALPGTFAERALAAALALPEGEAHRSAPPLPRQRRTAPRRWLRGAVTGLGAVAVGMISISAAAMGYFGEPIRHAVEQAPVVGPVVGRVIERVLPRHARAAKQVAPADVVKPVAPKAAPSAITAPAPMAEPAAPLTRSERRQRLRATLADPEARKAWVEAHPVAARRIERRLQHRSLRREMQRRRIEAGVASGTAPLIEQPAQQRWRIERRERLQQWRERRQRMLEERNLQRDPSDPPQP